MRDTAAIFIDLESPLVSRRVRNSHLHFLHLERIFKTHTPVSEKGEERRKREETSKDPKDPRFVPQG